MGKFSHLSQWRGHDDDDDDDFERLPRKGLTHVDPRLLVKYYRMDKTSIKKILEKIEAKLMPRHAGGPGGPMDPASKVLASLKVLATGSFQAVMNYSHV